jgi:hypothetical protein
VAISILLVRSYRSQWTSCDQRVHRKADLDFRLRDSSNDVEVAIRTGSRSSAC